MNIFYIIIHRIKLLFIYFSVIFLFYDKVFVFDNQNIILLSTKMKIHKKSILKFYAE